MTARGATELEAFTSAFMRDLEAVKQRNDAANGAVARRVFLFDVGANDARWADGMMRQARSVLGGTRGRPQSTRVELVLVEPQSRFYAANARTAALWNATFLPVAAWTEDGADLPFLANRNSEKAGLVSSMPETTAKRAARERRTQRIQAIDFAQYVLRELPADALAWLKLDIEGAEYSVLPRLLVSGALCRVRYLQIEWHLNNLPERRRAEGLALRKALGGLIDAGCPRSSGTAPPARRLLHEEYRGTNFDIYIPGLLEEAVRHAMPCVSTQRCGDRWSHLINLNGSVPVQGLRYDAKVWYYFAARFLTYINGV